MSLWLCVLLIYILNFIRNIFYLFVECQWINKNCLVKKRDQKLKKIYILIPMLEEQVIAADTYRHFRELIRKRENYYVIFITTNKEVKKENDLSTYDILIRCQKKYLDERIHVINYPDTEGVMAHQLNFAVQYINEMLNEEDYWIGIYNADSRIDDYTLDFIDSETCLADENVCFQQYSYFPLASKTEQHSIIASEILFQNRWSLLFEIPRAQYQLFISKCLAKIDSLVMRRILETIFEKMNYVIGHGLFLSYKTLEKIGGFPEDSINEDAKLGYLLNIARVSIYPIPLLEKAEFTNKLLVYIKQQETWFNGPFNAFQYMRNYLKKRDTKKTDIYEMYFRPFVLAIKLFFHAIYWLISPALMLLIIPLNIYVEVGFIPLIVYTLFVISYLPLVHCLISKLLFKWYGNQKFAKASITRCIIAYFIHSWGPALNIVKTIMGKNTIQNKYKTKRNDI